MKVSFHAYPGMDFAKKGKPSILTGDGTYEEVWVSPNTWRREVNFPGYHAVEVCMTGARKYRADSDYEPSRVLMLLEALLYPVPRNYISPEFSESHQAWKVEHSTAGSIPYVTLTHRERGSNDDWFYYSYDFLPTGVLIRANYLGLITSWSQDTPFAGRIAPGHLDIQAMGRTLLTADVVISLAGQSDPKLFEMDGPLASPGSTMRPFHQFEIKVGEYYDPTSVLAGPISGGVIRSISDRRGVTREIEVIDSPAPEDLKGYIESIRSKRAYPSKVDGDPCEWAFWDRM